MSAGKWQWNPKTSAWERAEGRHRLEAAHNGYSGHEWVVEDKRGGITAFGPSAGPGEAQAKALRVARLLEAGRIALKDQRRVKADVD